MFILMRALGILGRILLALGILVLLFTAYQLWGTGISESHAQSALRTTLGRQLPSGAAAQAKRLTIQPTTGTSASTPPVVAPPTVAPAPGQPVGTIQIPSIGLDQVVVEGVGTTDLQQGPGHYPGTPLPGQAGNVAIAGHRTTYAHPFYNLDGVAPGDQITITTPQGVFVYTAGAQTVVPPTDVSVIGPSGGAELTLTTCNPRYSALTRLVLKATLTRSLLFADRSPSKSTSTTPTTTPTTHQELAGTGTAGTGLAGTQAGAGQWVRVALWALASALVAGGVWVLGRRRRHRWAVYLPGTVVLLVVLFFFFGAVSPLLPAAY